MKSHSGIDLSSVVFYRRVFRMRDDNVYAVGHHDGHRPQLSSPVTQHVRHAAVGQYSLYALYFNDWPETPTTEWLVAPRPR